MGVNILSIETATLNCSVAIAIDGRLAALSERASDKYVHAEQLHGFIEKALREARLGVHELGAVAVSMGPGSYTGLRIGLSAAKGLCFALGKPLIGLSTLEVLARQHRGAARIYSVIDARRSEVYSAVFEPDYALVREARPEIINQDSFSEFIDARGLIVLGTAAHKCQALCPNPKIRFVEAMPSAANMGPAAYEKFLRGDFEDVAYSEPLYLKDFA